MQPNNASSQLSQLNPADLPQQRRPPQTAEMQTDPIPVLAGPSFPQHESSATPNGERANGESSRREESTAAKASRRFATILLELIDPDPAQVRSQNNLEAMEFAEMCVSVAEHGVLQPVLVRPSDRPGRYTLIAGEFRYEAARKAGHATLPCYIEEGDLDPTIIRIRQLSENLHRKDLPHMDLARAFHWLTQPAKEGGGGLKTSVLARILGKSEPFISEHRALLQLPAEDQQQLESGTLSFDQARAKLRARKGKASRSRKSRAKSEIHPQGTQTSDGSGNDAGSTDDNGPTAKTPLRLDNGHYVYARYSRNQPGVDLAVLITGVEQSEPDLDRVIQEVERHLHFLKLKQSRQRRSK